MKYEATASFDISIIAYDDFLTCMLSPTRNVERLWLELCSSDLVLGGLKLDDDMKCVHFRQSFSSRFQTSHRLQSSVNHNSI